MTLIAGILSRKAQPLPELVCASLERSLSRNPTDKVGVFKDHRSYFVKLDIGVFGESGSIVDSAGALSLMTGEPLLATQDERASSSRHHDLIAIHDQCLKNNWNVLREADGTFCMVHYQPQSGALALIADKLGVRPLYYWLDDDLIIFASALRILEECPAVPKKMDLRTVTEMVGLDTPLANRTPYADIYLLKPAEVLEITDLKTSRHCYWRWDDIEVSADPEPARLAAVFRNFQSAVNRRIGSDKATAAYLSGGLDSRCVVAALDQSGVQLHTVNFARAGTQDYYFGNQFAARIGSIHQSLPKEQGDRVPDYSSLMARAIEEFDGKFIQGDQFSADRPRLVWSGEGGSCLLGHVHQSESIVGLLRAGRVDDAIEEYLQIEQIHVPPKLFRTGVLNDTRDVIKQRIREELDQLHASDPGRNFYLFLALNDQRRKLRSHFENIDLHRLEFQLPFFDGQFVLSIIQTKLDWCLRHRFYLKWLSSFPPIVTEIPWQSYPGHEPCPLGVPLDLGYQWDEGYQAQEETSQNHRVVKQASELLRAADFPHRILNRRNLRLAAWVHSRGWRDYRYTILAAQTYYDYAKKCEGEFTLSLI